MNQTSVWRAATDAIEWREWDGEFVVYNRATGNTHHLNPIGGGVMLALLRHPSGVEMPALVRHVTAAFETTDSEDIAAAIAGVLAELAQLQLAIAGPA